MEKRDTRCATAEDRRVQALTSPCPHAHCMGSTVCKRENNLHKEGVPQMTTPLVASAHADTLCMHVAVVVVVACCMQPTV